MKHEYFLIGYRITTRKQGYKIIDKTTENNLKEVKREFERRNNYKKLLEKYNLTIVKSILFYN